MIKHTGYYIERWENGKYIRVSWYADYGVAEANRRALPGHTRLQPTYH